MPFGAAVPVALPNPNPNPKVPVDGTSPVFGSISNSSSFRGNTKTSVKQKISLDILDDAVSPSGRGKRKKKRKDANVSARNANQKYESKKETNANVREKENPQQCSSTGTTLELFEDFDSDEDEENAKKGPWYVQLFFSFFSSLMFPQVLCIFRIC